MASENHPSYFKIYLLLLGLFVVSVLGPEVAHWIGLEDDSVSRMILVLVTAFGIALVKAYYVLAYFMHLKFEKIYAPYLLLSMVAILFVFFFGTATDSMMSEGKNWEKLPIELPEAKGFDHHGESHGDDHGDHSQDDHSGHAH
ncbi:cytochrome C oxidase subunit IV family protein [Pelagicoccus sp. SDUM812005]|uniref:cytochrome C oxidase subunit IV family protein n=1 Tax=Pelagicoccus sp. SDUM812005 TaxID=3041257 RepID=UPI00280F2288|nr:cytochrome C oxidase subunit IV family protein [Pelagicoccus sp. SDUM812005]MDQ8179037.1 cytochrome C oxidase subunit IV family protein [Pelagicoccus sp. SDUM812005]